MRAPEQTVFVGDVDSLSSRIDLAHRVTPEFYARERARIFRRVWLAVGVATDVPEPGHYTTVEVPPLNASVLIVRDRDNQVRAFHNICRHRGQKLVYPSQGKARNFPCTFHGWVFSTEGALSHVTDATQFRNLDKANHSLIELASEVWENIVFVCFDPRPLETLREYLGDFYDQYRGMAEGRVKVCDHRIRLNTNWNMGVNAFGEGYHTLYVHKWSVPDYQGGRTNPDRHRPYLEVGRRFSRYSAHGNAHHKRTPAEALIYGHASHPLFPSFPSVDMDTLPPGINASRFDEWGFDIVHVFPNLVMSPNANMHGLMTFWPIDHAHTEIRNVRFTYAPKKNSDRVAAAYSVARVREVIREDMAPMELNTQAIASGFLPHIVLSDQERVIQNHYRIADELLSLE
ncbi:MAG: aromatic ring-hydroxylating oxygenase subunit alpha [Betaproteobacteria bacterium]